MRKSFPNILLILCAFFLTHTVFSQTKTQLPCEDLIMTKTRSNHNREVPLSFKVEFERARNTKTEPTYKWKISAGKIISGQGTNQILVNASKTNVERLTATVHIKETEKRECLTFGDSYVFFHYESEPTLFDTYSEKSTFDENLLTAYTERFAKALKEAPETTKGVIIYYLYEHNFPCSQETSNAEKRYNFVQKHLIEKHKISPERISSIYGMWRESLEFEFWIVPKDAKMPTARWDLIQHYSCGDLSISGIEKVDSKTQFVYFNAYVSEGQEVEYKWTVSAGEIVEGQGTGIIKVDISSVTEQEVKATVNAIDKCVEVCDQKDSYTTKIIP